MADGQFQSGGSRPPDLFRAPLPRQRQLNEVDRVLAAPLYLAEQRPSLLCQSMSLCRIILSFPSVYVSTPDKPWSDETLMILAISEGRRPWAIRGRNLVSFCPSVNC